MLEYINCLDTQITLWFNGSDSLFVDTVAWYATKTSTWIPLGVLLLFVLIRMKNWKNALLFIISIGVAIALADQIASGIFKPLVARLRPSHNPDLEGIIDLVNGYRGGRYGFFSSHAANTCAIAVYLSLLFQNKFFTSVICSWTLLNCWTRLYLGVHYVTDILTGLICGALIGYLVYRLYTIVLCKYNIGVVKELYSSQRANLLSEGVLLTYTAIFIYAVCSTII